MSRSYEPDDDDDMIDALQRRRERKAQARHLRNIFAVGGLFLLVLVAVTTVVVVKAKKGGKTAGGREDDSVSSANLRKPDGQSSGNPTTPVKPADQSENPKKVESNNSLIKKIDPDEIEEPKNTESNKPLKKIDLDEGQPRVAEKPIAPAPIAPAPIAPDKSTPELEKLVKDLKSKDAKVRLKAVEAIEQKGEEAASIARELCDAILDKDPRVAKAALIAVEKVYPVIENVPGVIGGGTVSFYKGLCALLLNPLNEQSLGLDQLGRLGIKSRPAIGVIIAKEKIIRQQIADKYIRLNSERPLLTAEQLNEIGRRSASPIQVQAMVTLEKIDPEDEAVVKFFRDATSGDNGLLAVTFLVKWAGDKEDRRKTVYPYIKLGVTQKTNQNTVKFIEWAAEYGALSKDLLPAMKALKLNENRAVRDAASAAGERIEAAVKQ